MVFNVIYAAQSYILHENYQYVACARDLFFIYQNSAVLFFSSQSSFFPGTDARDSRSTHQSITCGITIVNTRYDAGDGTWVARVMRSSVAVA